jgi:hypothetical protein
VVSGGHFEQFFSDPDQRDDPILPHSPALPDLLRKEMRKASDDMAGRALF